MKTSKRIVMAFCLSCFVAVPLRAQSTTEIELTRAEIQKARQAFVAEAIDLTEEEGLAFWPAYRDYRLDMARLGDRMVRLIDEFVKSSATLTVEQSNRLVDEYLDIRENEVAVRRKHVKVFHRDTRRCGGRTCGRTPSCTAPSFRSARCRARSARPRAPRAGGRRASRT